MARTSFAKIVGDRKLLKKFQQLDKRTGTAAIRTVTKKAMEPVLQLAKQRAPIRSGRLQKSLKIVAFRGGRRSRHAGASVQTGTRKQLRIEADNEYYYPAALEYGAPSRGIRARGFLRGALFLRRRQVINSVRNQLRAMLR